MSRLLGGLPVMSLPSTTICPESGWSKPATSRSAVVLPQPLGPSSETNSPVSSERLIPWSAVTGPNERHSSLQLDVSGHQRPIPTRTVRWPPRRPTRRIESIAAQVIPKLISVAAAAG